MGGFIGCCGGGGGSSTLAGLSDVALSSPTNDQVLTFNGTKWVNESLTANLTPDTHPSTPTANDDEFEFGSSIDLTGARFTGAVPWTAFNLGTGTNAIAEGSLVFAPALTSARSWGGYSQPAPAGSYTLVAKLAVQNQSSSTNGGVFFGTTTSGKLITFSLIVGQLLVQAMTDPNTFSANQAGPTAGIVETLGVVAVYGWVYLQITYDGTNLIFSISLTGVPGTFFQFFSETAASFLGGPPSLVGIGDNNFSASTQSLLIVDWWRRTA